jgi:uncharacterized protein YecE (DUF72 family)
LIFIGCAGWSLGREYWPQFPAEGTHLQRYAARFNGAEINSSFYRPHRRQTYERWADSVPEGFRFSVKVPKQTVRHGFITALMTCFICKGWRKTCNQPLPKAPLPGASSTTPPVALRQATR